VTSVEPPPGGEPAEPGAASPDPDAPGGSTGAAGLPPDPAAYDSPRATLARARGLSAPYIAGGRDPDPEPALEQDRIYGRLLILMVVVVVALGFVVGIIANLLEALGA
jgi:hypothetical protein